MSVKPSLLILGGSRKCIRTQNTKRNENLTVPLGEGGEFADYHTQKLTRVVEVCCSCEFPVWPFTAGYLPPRAQHAKYATAYHLPFPFHPSSPYRGVLLDGLARGNDEWGKDGMVTQARKLISHSLLFLCLLLTPPPSLPPCLYACTPSSPSSPCFARLC